MIHAANGIIDVDLHLPEPSITALVPYLNDYWTDQVVGRNIDRAPFAMTSYPPNAPIRCRPDWRGPAHEPGGDLNFLTKHGIDNFGTGLAIANILHGVVALHNPDMCAALVSAVNDHMRVEWLDKEPRLRGSILIPTEDPDLAVKEIERLAGDKRFVQILMPAMMETLHGNRRHWPIFEAAERHGLTIAIHAGSLYRHAPSVTGWPSYQYEDYIQQSMAFENIILSLLAEGVLNKFPDLRFVFLESGFAWLPTTLWRLDKTWRGVRAEVPWLDRPPSTMLKDRIFLSLQPVDPPGPEELDRVIRHIGGTDQLLFSTDYPHPQFDGNNALPDGLPPADIPNILAGNALRAYPRLAADPAAQNLLKTAEEA